VVRAVDEIVDAWMPWQADFYTEQMMHVLYGG
jgi:hypothetical protein